MRLLIILSIFSFLSGCESDEGKDLAKEYCKCITDARGDIYLVGECEEEFKERIKEIEKKPRVYNNFMEELENCQ